MIGIIWFGIARFIYFYHQRTQISFVDAFVDALRCCPADDVGLNLSLGSQGDISILRSILRSILCLQLLLLFLVFSLAFWLISLQLQSLLNLLVPLHFHNQLLGLANQYFVPKVHFHKHSFILQLTNREGVFGTLQRSQNYC